MSRKRSGSGDSPRRYNPETPLTPGLTSSRGRVVKPKLWGNLPFAVFTVTTSRRSEDTAASLAKRGSVPIRDETGRFIGVRPKTPAERMQKLITGSGGIFKSAAVAVLRQEKRLMSTGDIARMALKRGLIKCQGKTPEATMASALYTDVKRKEGQSIFIRPHEGLFGLREWQDQGLVFTETGEEIQDHMPQHAPKRPRTHSGSLHRQFSSRGSLYNDDDDSYGGNDGYGDDDYEEAAISDDDDGPTTVKHQPKHYPPQAQFVVDRIAPMATARSGGLGPSSRRASSGALQDFGGPSRSAGGAKVEERKAAAASASQSGGKAGANGSGGDGEGENASIFLLLDAAEELHRSSSHDTADAQPEPSTAATGFAESAARTDEAHFKGASSLPSPHPSPSRSRGTLYAPSARPGSFPKLYDAGQATPRLFEDGSASGRISRPPPLQVSDPNTTAARPAYYPSDAAAYSPFGQPVTTPATIEDRPVATPLAGTPELDLTVQGMGADRLSSIALPPSMPSVRADQVNILNLPLPDFDLSVQDDSADAMAADDTRTPAEMEAADLAEAEAEAQAEAAIYGLAEAGMLAANGASGLSGALDQIGDKSSLVMASMPKVSKEKLRVLEQNVLLLEESLGTAHPQVGKAWLFLSRVYQAGSSAEMQQKAEAALVRSWDIFSKCQATFTQEDLAPPSTTSFSYLMEKMRSPVSPAPLQAADAASSDFVKVVGTASA
ncbi:hypothetical protein WJX72_007316 [[Myrmecia] bisecta]|uniref:HTH HARE-type domain-containing protein n=1 Tax=[Myrmecia] bisecta TaxID=41462 RepID=A0AAW1R793_9CHLO